MEKRQKKRLLLDYLADNLKHHNWWAYRYFFCEFLALVNIIGKLDHFNDILFYQTVYLEYFWMLSSFDIF